MTHKTCPERSRRRHRGGQPGNKNARTNGFYSRALPPGRLHKLEDAAEVRGLDQEIALLRSKIAIAGENSEDCQVLEVLWGAPILSPS